MESRSCILILNLGSHWNTSRVQEGGGGGGLVVGGGAGGGGSLHIQKGWLVPYLC